MTDEKEYGSLGRLAPEWDGDGRERNLTADDIYERFFGWVEDVKGIEPWPHQEEAIMDLLAGDHVILNTPTGSGKSLVALGMHFAALCTGRRSYYTAPIKALVSEKFFDLVEVFGRDNVGMITGDSHINADAPIICCTAEIFANQPCAKAPMPMWASWRWTNSIITVIRSAAGRGRCHCSRCRRPSSC